MLGSVCIAFATNRPASASTEKPSRCLRTAGSGGNNANVASSQYSARTFSVVAEGFNVMVLRAGSKLRNRLPFAVTALISLD